MRNVLEGNAIATNMKLFVIFGCFAVSLWQSQSKGVLSRDINTKTYSKRRQQSEKASREEIFPNKKQHEKSSKIPTFNFGSATLENSSNLARYFAMQREIEYDEKTVTNSKPKHLNDLSKTRVKRSLLFKQINSSCTQPLLSCKNRCVDTMDAGGDRKELRCSCDPYCNYFKDCCHDYVPYCLKSRAGSAVTSKVPDENWSCMSGIWVIKYCPVSWKNQTDRLSCASDAKINYKNYADMLPATTPDGKTFGNRMCARCHGYKEEELAYYSMDFKCSLSPPAQSTPTEKMKFVFKRCILSRVAPKSGIPRRYCIAVKIPNCNSRIDRSIKARCVNGSYGLVYVRSRKENHKNEFCAICMERQPSSCGPGKLPDNLEDKDHVPGSKPFSLIFDIGAKSQIQRDSSVTVKCSKEGEVYDWRLEACRKGHQYTPKVSTKREYRVALWMKTYRLFSITALPFTYEQFGVAISKLLQINSTSISVFDKIFLGKRTQMYFMMFDLKLEEESSDFSVMELFNLTRKRPKPVFKVGTFPFTAAKITIKTMTCVATDTYSPLQYQLIPGTSSVVINSTGEVLDKIDYFSNNTIMFQGRPQPVGNIVVCRQLLSGNCSGTYIFLDRHEYVMFPNRSLWYNAAGRLYEYEDYTVMNGSIMICTDLIQTYVKQTKKEDPVDETVLIVLTYVGFSISIVSLVFVLVTYSLFPKLRTIPGINLMNLSCGLLVAHLVWLTGSGLTTNGTVCTAIAIILHYSFLVSFAWMSIIAFDTWRAFSSRTYWPRTKDKKHKHNVIRLTIGWFPLVLFVSGCIALDQSDVVTIGYGGNESCWITNSRANLCIFAIPVAISLVWNAFFFIQVIFEYVKIRKKSKLLLSQHKARRDTAIFARIAALMGFTWVFGFIAPVTTPYLMYPFVILNTLQGLYLAVAFGFTRRVKLLYRKRLCKNVIFIT